MAFTSFVLVYLLAEQLLLPAALASRHSTPAD